MNYTETRPWGSFENLLDSNLCKVKQIVIKPDQAPSYQYHHKREEYWIIVQGNGQLTLNDEIQSVKPGDVIHVPKLAKHQIKNVDSQDLIFIEVQLGEYFGEDDIVRLKDSYGRI
jgi:mannose-6-phosphate isomerase-like protein (cupin superfamily)